MRPIRTLQLAFAVGIAALLAVFLAIRLAGEDLALQLDADLASTIAVVMSGLSAVLIVIGLMVLRPRVPRRGSRTSVDAYWTAPGTAQAVLRLYFILEAAGTLAAIAFFFTGQPLPALTAMAAIFALLMCGPAVFADP